MYIKKDNRLIWIPSLDSMNDFVEPGGLDWNNPFSIYAYTVTYTWKHESGKTGTRQIRVKHPAHAGIILEHWNRQNTAWRYETTED